MTAIIRAILQKPFVRYLVVGGSAFLAEFASFFVFFYFFNFSLISSNGLSFGCGFITNFTLNRLWTFAGQPYAKNQRQQLIRYTIVAFINLGLTLLLVGTLRAWGLDPRVAKLLAMVITSVWNFLLFQKLVFKHQSSADGRP